MRKSNNPKNNEKTNILIISNSFLESLSRVIRDEIIQIWFAFDNSYLLYSLTVFLVPYNLLQATEHLFS